MKRDPFKEYLKESEPEKVDKSYAWSTAIGLQAVDGLKPSKYLIDTALQNIEGKITIKEAQNLIESYYKEKPVHLSDEERTEEADKVSSRIAEILSETAFSFSPNEYISIHRKLFQGIYSHAGKIRNYNITKKEWVLDGETVIYGSASELRATLEYDFSQEKSFSYRGLSMDEIIHHLAIFVSRERLLFPQALKVLRVSQIFRQSIRAVGGPSGRAILPIQQPARRYRRIRISSRPKLPEFQTPKARQICTKFLSSIQFYPYYFCFAKILGENHNLLGGFIRFKFFKKFQFMYFFFSMASFCFNLFPLVF